MQSPTGTGENPMTSIDLAPAIEELKKVLGDRVDEETLVAELNKYINEYHVELTSAKRGIIRKYGGADTGFATAESASKKIADLTGTESNVDITAKVVYVENKSITVKGLSKTIVSGIIGDDSGTASFTVWEPGSVQLEKGSVYVFRKCYCKTWNDKVQVNIGRNGAIAPAPDVSFEVPGNVVTLSASDVAIGDIREGMGNVNVKGKVLSVEARRINVKGVEKVVYSGLIADPTGKIQYSAWHDFGLKGGDVISAKNCYIRAWKGIPQLNIGDRAEVQRLDETMDIESGETRRTADEITRVGGGLDLTVEGTVVDVKSGSGLIKRCPECRRALNNGACTAHGPVDGIPDLRLKLVVDDGTGAIGASVNREGTEKLAGVSLQSAIDVASRKGESAVAGDIMRKVLLRRIRISGNVMSDEYGPTMIVSSASIVETDLQAEAEKLLAEVEASI